MWQDAATSRHWQHVAFGLRPVLATCAVAESNNLRIQPIHMPTLRFLFSAKAKTTIVIGVASKGASLAFDVDLHGSSSEACESTSTDWLATAFWTTGTFRSIGTPSNDFMKNLFHPIIPVLTSFLFAGQTVAAETQSWDYLMSGASPVSGTQRPTSGKNRAELFSDKGEYSFRIRGSTAPACFAREKPAAVEQDEKTIAIIPEPLFANCQKIRLVINKDGSGGIQQVDMGKKGQIQWVEEETQSYGLTP